MIPDAAATLKKRVIMISGDEGLLRRRMLQALVQEATGGEDDFDLETTLADASSFDSWLASAGTAPFLAPYRTLVVRNLLRFGPPPESAAKLKDLPETGRLILVADDERAPDSNRERSLGDYRTKWEQAVSKAGGAVLKLAGPGKAIVEAVRLEAQDLGKKMSAPAAMALAEMTGGSLTRAVAELEKLALYVGSSAEIREEHVRAAASPSREYQVFTFVDALVERRTGEALKQLRILIGSTNKVEQAAQSSVLPQVSRALRLVLQARCAADARLPVSAAKEFGPKKHNLSDASEFVQRKAINQARNASVAQIASCLREVSDADVRMKGMLPSTNALDSLDLMVMRCIECLSR